MDSQRPALYIIMYVCRFIKLFTIKIHLYPFILLIVITSKDCPHLCQMEVS